ncbi:MAG: hypothetical protein AAGG06_00295 [Pseudomonadota bacterium]
MFSGFRFAAKILWGEGDPWIPLDRGKAPQSLIPHAPVEGAPGLGHLPHSESPLAVAEAIREFPADGPPRHREVVCPAQHSFVSMIRNGNH